MLVDVEVSYFKDAASLKDFYNLVIVREPYRRPIIAVIEALVIVAVVGRVISKDGGVPKRRTIFTAVRFKTLLYLLKALKYYLKRLRVDELYNASKEVA